MCQSSGNKTTEFWLSIGIILSVLIVATILLLINVINQDNWTKIIIYVCGIVGPVYATGRTIVKTFSNGNSNP